MIGGLPIAFGNEDCRLDFIGLFEPGVYLLTYCMLKKHDACNVCAISVRNGMCQSNRNGKCAVHV